MKEICCSTGEQRCSKSTLENGVYIYCAFTMFGFQFC